MNLLLLSGLMGSLVTSNPAQDHQEMIKNRINEGVEYLEKHAEEGTEYVKEYAGEEAAEVTGKVLSKVSSILRGILVRK